MTDIDEQHHRWALAVVNVARRMLDSRATLHTDLRDEWQVLEELFASGVHSCHPNCQLPYCRMQREIEELRAGVERLRHICIEVGESGISFSDPRLNYIEVQIDVRTWELLVKISEKGV